STIHSPLFPSRRRCLLRTLHALLLRHVRGACLSALQSPTSAQIQQQRDSCRYRQAFPAVPLPWQVLSRPWRAGMCRSGQNGKSGRVGSKEVNRSVIASVVGWSLLVLCLVPSIAVF